jgi:uncharacterized membrane protein YphA (DoxX/SURF4 family)
MPAAAALPRESSSRAFAVAGWLGGVALGLVLAVAAGLKALDPVTFGEEIAAQGAGFGLPPTAAAFVALAIEALLGAALILNLRTRGVMVAATALVLFFVFLTGRAAWLAARGLADAGASCGCFGALVERTPTEAFVQDLLLMGPALALAWLGRPGARRGLPMRWGAVGAIAAVVVALAAAAPGLPLDDVATRLKPGVVLGDLCAGAGDGRVCLDGLAPALGRGVHLVVLADAGEPFADLAARLNAYVRAGGDPPVTVLADLTPERRQELYWQAAPAFDLHEVPRALLRPLYRRLPRSFRLEEGRVTATWAGLPPSLAAAPAARRTD